MELTISLVVNANSFAAKSVGVATWAVFVGMIVEVFFGDPEIVMSSVGLMVSQQPYNYVFEDH